MACFKTFIVTIELSGVAVLKMRIKHIIVPHQTQVIDLEIDEKSTHPRCSSND